VHHPTGAHDDHARWPSLMPSQSEVGDYRALHLHHSAIPGRPRPSIEAAPNTARWSRRCRLSTRSSPRRREIYEEKVGGWYGTVRR